jgi:predicted PurR-regulated permease PerM
MKAFGSLTFSLLILGSILFAGLIWIAGDIFALFVVAFFLSYLFDPIAGWLVARGLSRTLAALVITGGIVILIAAILALIGPIAYAQLQDVIRVLQSVFTDVMARMRQELLPYFPALSQIGLGALVKPAETPAAPIAGQMAASLLATVGLTMLAPVVTFYLLKDWPTMLTRLLEEVPPRKRPVVRRLARKIDAVLAGFLRGQAWVCLCVGLIFTVGYLIIGLKYAVAIGMISGALKFLPYVGTVIAFVMAIASSVGQAGWDGFLVAGIMVTFVIAEFTESAILSPRIIGNRVRLHPALVIFAVLVGGKLLGIIGVFIAIPVFAVGRVLLSFWLHRQRIAEPAPRIRVKTAKAVSPQEIRLVHDGKP